MFEIGAFAAKTHFSQLLNRVGQGETLAITKHGQKIALLVPVKSKPTLSVTDAKNAIFALRNKISKRGIKLSPLEIQKMKEMGRK